MPLNEPPSMFDISELLALEKAARMAHGWICDRSNSDLEIPDNTVNRQFVLVLVADRAGRPTKLRVRKRQIIVGTEDVLGYFADLAQRLTAGGSMSTAAVAAAFTPGALTVLALGFKEAFDHVAEMGCCELTIPNTLPNVDFLRDVERLLNGDEAADDFEPHIQRGELLTAVDDLLSYTAAKCKKLLGEPEDTEDDDERLPLSGISFTRPRVPAVPVASTIEVPVAANAVTAVKPVAAPKTPVMASPVSTAPPAQNPAAKAKLPAPGVSVTFQRLPLSVGPKAAVRLAGVDATVYGMAGPVEGERHFYATSITSEVLSAQSTVEEVVDALQLVAGPLLLWCVEAWLYIPDTVSGDVAAKVGDAFQERCAGRTVVHPAGSRDGRYSFMIKLAGH